MMLLYSRVLVATAIPVMLAVGTVNSFKNGLRSVQLLLIKSFRRQNENFTQLLNRASLYDQLYC